MMTKVLFVCMGNICRSPSAEGVFRHLVNDAGLGDVVQVTAEDFRDFDLILAMDWDNLSAMQQQCPKAYQHKLMLLMRFANEFEEATVPDPYYGGADGFGKVLDYLEDACQGVLELVRKRATQYQAA
jgi:protein-tyrosine phosphatase